MNVTNLFARLKQSFSPAATSSAQPPVPAASTTPEPLSTPVNRRRARRREPQLPPPLYRRWGLWLVVIGGAAIGAAATQTYRYLQVIEAGLPQLDALETFTRDGTLTIKAADGRVLQQLGPATREKVAFTDLPPALVNAFIASEDRRFYEHTGVDVVGIARALHANVQEREVVEGASTITQQLARIVFLDQEQTLTRKLREALLARKMERHLTKEDILEDYLNLVYLGSGAYGVADAAWVYFSKSVAELTLSEAAMIAGMAPAPSVYSPLVDLAAAQTRRNIVLQRMAEDGLITPAEAAAAIATELQINPSTPKYLYSEVPYFTSYVQQQLPELVPPEAVEVGGLTVETTLDLAWQQHAEATVQEAIAQWGPGQRFEQAALVAIDPRTGAIKALVGGDDFLESQFNRAVQAQRQPGSTFKAFVYTTAIATGMSPYKSYADAKYVVDGYEPKNYGGSYSGTVSLREALTSSINIVAVKVLVDVGFDPVINLANAMGIQSELVPAYSLALGASEVNLLELTSAYGTLAAEGIHHPAHAVVRVYDRRGQLIYDATEQLTASRAVDAETAAIVTWMLEGVVQGGTGSRAAIGRPVAGKTGTSERNRDLWFVGYIPQVVVGVWLGNDDSSPTWGVSSTAAATWRLFMRGVIDDIPVVDFPDLPRLSGREGTIAAEPIRPGRVTAANTTSTDTADADADEEDSGSGGAPETTSPTEDKAPTPAIAEETKAPPRSDASPVPSPEAAPATAPPAPTEDVAPPIVTAEPSPLPEVAPPPPVAPIAEPAVQPIAPSAVPVPLPANSVTPTAPAPAE